MLWPAVQVGKMAATVAQQPELIGCLVWVWFWLAWQDQLEKIESIMPVLSFGSLNIDHVYQLEHIVRPGETLAAIEPGGYAVHPGGKGLNQSLAMSRAGMSVCHAGRIGSDGLWLRTFLEDNGVDCTFTQCWEGYHTGHAMIQVGREGQNSTVENSIVLYSGANHSWTDTAVRQLFTSATIPPDCYSAVVCQNEMNGLPALLDCAHTHHIPVIFNAAPYCPDLQKIDYTQLHTLLVNETEAMDLAEATSVETAFNLLKRRMPNSRLVITLGADGVWGSYRQQDYSLLAYPVPLVDTTAAGDTFAGYYTAAILKDEDFFEALKAGSRAAALAVGRVGAAPSIPYLDELNTL